MSETRHIDSDPFFPARFNMVQQQIRPWGVMDDRVLSALAAVPREQFVPDAYRSLAYADIEVPIGQDRVMLAPKIVARMLQALQVEPGDRALAIGAGNGFLAACMAHLGARVLCLEDVPELAEEAKARLAKRGESAVEVRLGSGLSEPVQGAPFNVIAVSGSVPTEEPLAGLEAQLANNGRLFIVAGQAPVMQAIRVTRMGARGLRREILFETCVAPLDQAPAPDAFVF